MNYMRIIHFLSFLLLTDVLTLKKIYFLSATEQVYKKGQKWILKVIFYSGIGLGQYFP